VRIANEPTGSARSGLLLDAVGQLGDLRVDRPAFGHQGADFPVGVDDRGVVAAAELLADLGQRQVGELAAQVHGDVPGGDEHPGPRGPAQVLQVDRLAVQAGERPHPDQRALEFPDVGGDPAGDVSDPMTNVSKVYLEAEPSAAEVT